MSTAQQLATLKQQLEDVLSVMPNTHAEQRRQQQAAAEINFEIIRLEEPETYSANKVHFDNYHPQYS